MANERFLVYQPNHGIGVELAMVHHAARLARVLDRTVVVPLLPILETQQYQGGIDEYFDMPERLNWISTREFCEEHGGQIGRLFALEPQWQREYRSKVTRERHPVWLDNIRRHPYFELAGMQLDKVTRQAITGSLNASEVQKIFGTDDRTIGFSYHHSLLEGYSTYEEPYRDPWWRDDVPPQPRWEFFEAVRLALGDRPALAMHVRRGSLDNAQVIDGVELPALAAFEEHIRPGPGLAYLATDTAEVHAQFRKIRPDIRQIETGHFTRDAVLDLCACVLANRFVGTDYSTFTQYILHARTSLGRPRDSAVLL